MVVSDRVEVLGVERGEGEKKNGLVLFWKRQRKRAVRFFSILRVGRRKSSLGAIYWAPVRLGTDRTPGVRVGLLCMNCSLKIFCN